MTQKAAIKTELAKFMEDAKLAYNDLRIEKINKPISEADIVARLMTKEYGYENRISEITSGNVSSIEIGNIIDDIVANGEKVIVGITKGGGVSTYYVEINGKYYPIHFSNSDINIKEDEAQDTAGENDSIAFSAVSSNDNVVSANAKNVNGVLTVELEGKSRGTARITVIYGTAEPKIVEVNVKGKTLITIEAEKDENQVAKGTIASPSELIAEYVDGVQITLGATPSGSYKFKGWYIGDSLLSTSADYDYTVPDNLVNETTIVAKFKDTEPTDIFVSFEESTGILRFYNSEHTDEPGYVIGTLYQENGANLNLKNKQIGSIYNPWKNSSLKIKKVIFVDEVVPVGTGYLFYNFSNLEEIQKIENLDTIKVTSMEMMFCGCSKITDVNLGTFDTSNVTSMDSMFRDCTSLTSLDLSGLNISSVTNMNSMFSKCSELASIYFGRFDKMKVESMGSMFYSCSSLRSLDLSGFDTSNVTGMASMFYGCSSLTDLNLGGLITSKVTNMSCMFYNCGKLNNLDLSGFDTVSVNEMSGLFYNCNSLTSLDLSGFNTEKVTGMRQMFYNCSNLTSLDLSGFNTSLVTNYGMSMMFYNCSSLTSLNLSEFDTSGVVQMPFMFYNCRSLTNLDLSSFDTSSVTNMQYMFNSCENLKKIYVNNTFITTKVSESSSMFTSCTSIIGGENTIYDSTKTDKTYARIDKEEQPGYFTDIKDKPSE